MIDYFEVMKWEKDRILEGLKSREITEDNIINIESFDNKSFYRVWYKMDG